MSAAPLHGLLLCGGASRRMRRDKAQLNYGAEPQLLRAWRLLTAFTERAFVSVRDSQHDEPLRASLPQLIDTYDAVGPVAGILSAQDAHPEAAWLVIACDLPRLDDATLRTLVARRDPTKEATAFTSRFDGLPEPLCAIWEPASHARLKQRYDSGSYCPRKALIQGDTLLLPAPGEALDNVNTPEEFVRMHHQLEMPS